MDDKDRSGGAESQARADLHQDTVMAVRVACEQRTEHRYVACRERRIEEASLTQRLLKLAVLCVSLLLSDPLGSQGLYGFLKDAPAGRFNEKDWELLRAALLDTLEQDNDSAKADWTNPAKRHSGTITALKTFRSDEGRDCKRVLIENNANGLTSANRFNLCRYEDGSWREMQTGAPFTAPVQ